MKILKQYLKRKKSKIDKSGNHVNIEDNTTQTHLVNLRMNISRGLSGHFRYYVTFDKNKQKIDIVKSCKIKTI